MTENENMNLRMNREIIDMVTERIRWFFEFLNAIASLDLRYETKRVIMIINPTPTSAPPYWKMAVTPKNNDPKEPKLCDFAYIQGVPKLADKRKMLKLIQKLHFMGWLYYQTANTCDLFGNIDSP